MTDTPYDLDMPGLRELQRMEDEAMGLIQSLERKQRESDRTEKSRFAEKEICCICDADDADDDVMDIEDKSDDDGNCFCRQGQRQDHGKQQQQWEHQHQRQQGPDHPFDQRGLDLGYENNGNIEGSSDEPSQSSISSTTDSIPDGKPNSNLNPTITDHHNHQQNPPRATKSVQQEADEQSNSSPYLHLHLKSTTALEQSPRISLHLRGGGPSRKTLSSHRFGKEAGVDTTYFGGSGGGSHGARQTYIGSGTRYSFPESLGRKDEEVEVEIEGDEGVHETNRVDDRRAEVDGGEEGKSGDGIGGEDWRGRRGKKVVVFDRRDWSTRWEIREEE